MLTLFYLLLAVLGWVGYVRLLRYMERVKTSSEAYIFTVGFVMVLATNFTALVIARVLNVPYNFAFFIVIFVPITTMIVKIVRAWRKPRADAPD